MGGSKKLTGINDAASAPPPPPKKSSSSKKSTKKTPATTPIDVSKLLSGSGEQITMSSTAEQPKPNIILHLKCHLKDLNVIDAQIRDQYTYNPNVPPEIVAYNKNDNSYFLLDEKSENEDKNSASAAATNDISTAAAIIKNPGELDKCDDQSTSIPTINAKLKKLKISLYKNAPVDDKQSACFWCTCDYDNATCYIPKYEIDNSIHAYGAFCSPECAAGFLLFEEIDDSTKFERLYLLNNIYGKIYEYKDNIKPAPKPFYLLNKFYGNLTIEEFRALSRQKQHYKQLLIIDKPLTRVLPELHEEKDKSITGASCSGMYRVKRQSDSAGRQTKNDILKDTFGFH